MWAFQMCLMLISPTVKVSRFVKPLGYDHATVFYDCCTAIAYTSGGDGTVAAQLQ